MTEEAFIFCVFVFPVIFGYVIPTIIDRFIKNYEEKHKCKHKHTYWQKKPDSNFFCISGDTMLLVCKDCGEIIDECFWEHEGMGYK